MGYVKKNKIPIYTYGNTPEEKYYWHHRQNALDRAMERMSIPTLKTCIKYKFTREDLSIILEMICSKVDEAYPNGEQPNIPPLPLKPIQEYITESENETCYYTETEDESGYTTDTTTSSLW